MKSRYKFSCAIAAILSGYAGAAIAADAAAATSGVEEIVVTAQRRTETVQNVPMTIQALTGATLQQLNVTNLDDLLRYTPNVSYGSNGPGQGNIFMRGLSAGAVGNQSQATIGSFPNVALYLDDQSMQFPTHNADIYLVDMERVEVLEGPQGTLFGGGAQAGAVRYITNKPKLNLFEGSAEASYGFTEGGGENSSANFTINLPLVQDKLAARLVIYDDHQGGYIDNVPSTFTRSNQDPGNFYLGIPAVGGVCPNHLPAGPAGCTIPNGQVYNNAAVAGKDSNPVDYQGMRLSVLWDVNPDWNVLITETLQNMNAQGVDAQFPTGSDFQPLKPLQNTFFEPSYDKDKLESTSWTVNGKIGWLKAIYTGAYSERNINQQQDYTNYSRTGGGIEYQCTGPSSYWGNAGPTTCNSPLAYWHDTIKNTHLSNEIRFSSPDDWRLRFIAGGYEEQFRIYDVMDFDYKTIPSCTTSYLATANLAAAACVANLIPGFAGSNIVSNNPNQRGDNVAFGEDTQRGYDQYAIFGSVDFDVIPNVLTVTAGTRWYDYNEYETGSQYSVGAPGIGPGVGAQDTPNGQCGAACITNITAEGYKTTYTGFKNRFNVTWHVNHDTLAYFTYSEGFRPGGFNRSDSKAGLKDASGAAQFHYPGSYAPDTLTNYEIGLKSTLFEHRLQFNLSGYYMNWDNVQFAMFNPPFGINTTFVTNGPSYRVLGLEAQFVGKVTDNLTIQGSGSYNHDTQTASPCLVSNIATSPIFGQCVTSAQIHGGGATPVPFQNPFGAVGSTPPFSPAFQANLRARYDWDVFAYKAYVQVGANYVGGQYNEPASYGSGVGVVVPTTVNLRYYQPAYATLDASIGFTKDRWHAELFGTNLTNSNASTFTSSGQFIESQVPLRPLVVGLRVGAKL
jgi:iron complex outermembrane receptor protein